MACRWPGKGTRTGILTRGWAEQDCGELDQCPFSWTIILFSTDYILSRTSDIPNLLRFKGSYFLTGEWGVKFIWSNVIYKIELWMLNSQVKYKTDYLLLFSPLSALSWQIQKIQSLNWHCFLKVFLNNFQWHLFSASFLHFLYPIWHHVCHASIQCTDI